MIKAKIEENLSALDNYDFRAKQQNLISNLKKYMHNANVES